jgi:hypothetical protein
VAERSLTRRGRAAATPRAQQRPGSQLDGRFGAPIDRGWNHLEEIRSTLADLQGSGSLAQELIQNADDAEATKLTFHFTPEALVVEDDGGFTKCADPAAPECGYADTSRVCDFHAFRELGGATKRSDALTTGAFGIGFLSVYQVTDRPEIISSGLHWIVDEANRRQLPCLRCERRHRTQGTEIVLPWARTRTPLRKALGATVVTEGVQRNLVRDFVAAIPECMLFLPYLKTISVVADSTRRTFKRDETENAIVVTGPGRNRQEWSVVRGEFEKPAKQLRTAFPDLVADRPADVALAFPRDGDVEGRLFATLPTQVATELPFHINARFFPRRDRKGVLLDAGPQTEWNRAAIAAAADALAASCVPLSRLLGPKRFWTLIQAASKLETHHSVDARALEPLWVALANVLPSREVMWTSSGEWELVERTALPPQRATTRRLLADLGIPTVAPTIKPSVPWQKLRLRQVSLERLIQALAILPLTERCPEPGLPYALRDVEQRDALKALLASLVDKLDVDDALRRRIRALPLWEGSDRRFHSFASAYLADRETVAAIEHVLSNPIVYWPQRRATRKLGELGDRLKVETAVDALIEADPDSFDPSSARRSLRWLEKHLKEITEEQLEALRDVEFIPSTSGLSAARNTVRPGGFTDHLGITQSLDVGPRERLNSILKALKVRRLSFVDYVGQHLPAELATIREFDTDALVSFIRDCARQQDELETKPGLVETLRGLSFVPCRDDVMREPGATYFDSRDVLSVLGAPRELVHPSIKRGSAAGAFLRRLGASDAPRPEDIVQRAKAITGQGPPTPQRRTAVVAILAYLAKAGRLREQQGLTTLLKQLTWLPAEDDDARWHRPEELFRTRHRSLFATSGRFVRLTTRVQRDLAPALQGLGVREEPTVELVVEHVSNLAEVGNAASNQVFLWLDSKAHDPDVKQLREIAFLPSTAGALHLPAEIFRDRHPLSDRLPVLEGRVLKFGSLLSELDVPRRPRATHAVEVLQHLAAGRKPGDRSSADDSRAVRSCWHVIGEDSEVNVLRSLDGHAVVPDADGRLWTPADVVFNDQPEVVQSLTPELRARIVPDEGRGAAYERAGVGALSKRLVIRVLDRRRCRRDRDLEALLMARQQYLARVVIGQRGDPRRLLDLARRLRVRSTERLRVRYLIQGIQGVGMSGPVGQRAVLDGRTGELFIETPEVDWAEVAAELKQPLLPHDGPAVLLPIAQVLALPEDEASGLLTSLRYPSLSSRTWAELQSILAEWESRRVTDDDAQDESAKEEEEPEEEGEEQEEDQEEAQDEEDEEAEDAEEVEEDEEEDEEEEDEEEVEEDEDEQEGDGEEGANGEGDTGKKKRKRGRKGGSSDRRLVTYVDKREVSDSRNEQTGTRTVAGEAGVDLVVDFLKRHFGGRGYEIRKMPDKNKGFDILVQDAANRSIQWIEVKSTEEKWGVRGVGLSGPQFDLALKKGQAYWLYVVEHLYEPDARIWSINDPACQVTNFQYDEGWTQVATGGEWVTGARRPRA